MTHRRIEAIPLNGIEPGIIADGKPLFEWVDPGTLLVDEGYQRDLSERSLKLIRRIVSGWNWAKFKPPIAVLTDAGLELLDGQCTSIGACTHPDIDEIPVMIVAVAERADRAAAFIGQNKDRVAVTTLQIHAAAVTAGDADALAVERVCQAAGVTVLRAQPGSGRYEPGSTVAVSTIAGLVRARGEEQAGKILSILVKARCAPIGATQIKALDLLLSDAEYAGMTESQIAGVIPAMAPNIEHDVAVFRAAHPSTPAWKATAICWFKNRRQRPNPPPAVASITPTTTLQKAAGSASPNLHGKRDARPKLSGWMPGPVLKRCSGCDETYQGDARSRSCADCAYGCKEAKTA
jgi:hypothetical protein